MDKEKLERFARMMEPFEKANKIIAAIPAAARLADAFPVSTPAISNLNRIGELTAKVNSISSSWNLKALYSHDFPNFNQLSAVNQQANAVASGLSKSIKVSSLAATTFLGSFKACNLIVSNAVLEFIEHNREFSKKISESFELLPEAFLVLGNHGWYLHLEFELGLAIELLHMLQSDETKEVDDYLVTYFTSELKGISQDLIARHPTRKNIFEDIIFCVEHKKFFAAIPTVLSQVDGICSDMINMKFFSKDHMTSPVIMLSENDAMNHPFQINRHTVMHGIDVKYGTEVNFFKCFSLLKYLSDVLFELEEEAI